MIRDQALATSGLLVKKIGGPGVYPPLPPEVAAGASRGEGMLACDFRRMSSV